MRLTVAAAVVFACAINAGAQKPAKEKPAPIPPMTLTGCIQAADKAPGQFTISEQKDGPIYRLTGTNVRDFVGRRVTLVGAPPDTRKLKITGGLTPTPNIAAQAGAIDPSRAVTQAATEASDPGRVALPEFRVKSVRPATGACEQ